jgi:tRNA threonylcarbamoyladenosine biosynthesis protein TsaE
LLKKNITYSTTSGEETINLGKSLGSQLNAGDVVGVTGALGSGKTWLAKGVGIGLGIRRETVITSPSFALVNEYEGRIFFYHLDLYRLKSMDEILMAGLDEYIRGEGVAYVEWADRCPQALPEWAVLVSLTIKGENERQIDFSGNHPRAQKILTDMDRTYRA